MTDANKKAFLPNAGNCSLIRWSTFKVFLDITSIQLSWFFLTSSILCLFRATKRCRYGTNRTGITVRRKTTVTKLVLMCIHGMLNSFYWRPFLRDPKTSKENIRSRTVASHQVQEPEYHFWKTNVRLTWDKQ